ncbi:HAMP domain-containing protein [Sphingomonas koreensis]|jgi:two-component system sensor histidine kinase ChvG|uniref:histidine kinase n=1 Tax=Sphingomonas koreensis TaxID=93064 RepID=A0A1L6JA31_9SPHN|nr:stimulus-sensing domain-containing protein [Sphingomonas koreensis]APR52754.1 sensor histidine kinase [Sphingomonas koreensis]MDC7811080.1 stimulus-sensing domain-containing protein [Sphingomonas koreensis]RSU19262.1 HAMP domain-containing protein [Sphingomonas koreensis]RSU28416.1 HAMP domain-containing protein [Sphingomonas koreensis]RSU31264.1 HAMP domain-containing protein [Sphingomonas koreensis]
MAPVTDSPTNSRGNREDREDRDLSLRWSARLSLTPRILAVNIFALAMLAGGFFYLDSFRARIIDDEVEQAGREARLIAQAVAMTPPEDRTALILRVATEAGLRIRLYDRSGRVTLDTRALGLNNVVLRDPDKDPWGQSAARFLDAAIDTVAGADRAPQFRERAPDKGMEWPDLASALRSGEASATVWRAPDRTPVITAAASYGPEGAVFTTDNAREITQRVRIERFRLAVVLAVAIGLSVFLSLFLARTIVRPLRRLARAAVRVRLGRAREVIVPRLPERRDEIGHLARSLSDMSLALRARIDATEAFAADLAHELKNPLASLRSAVDGLANVRDPELQERLLAIVRDDVHRLDRLISDISEASRLDAQLSRAKFEPVDVAAMLEGLIAQRSDRGVERGVRLRLDQPVRPVPRVMGEGARLERVFENLIDNAISFSPEQGLVTLSAASDGEMLEVRVEDEGPGVPEEAREAVFRRFHSVRPDSEAFGQHSGLGLAIARTIVEGHGGMIGVESREDRMRGARFVVRLPLVQPN